MMKPSNIIFPKVKGLPKALPKKNMLAKAYLTAREQELITDIELQRSNVIVMDNAGNVIKIKLQQEH
ncbi:hypothetical protein ACXJY6_10550 [Vibrio sp. RC27]